MLHGAEPRVHIMCTVGRPPPAVTHNELKFGEKSLSARSFLRLQPGKLNQWTAMMIPARHTATAPRALTAAHTSRGNCRQSATHTFPLLELFCAPGAYACALNWCEINSVFLCFPFCSEAMHTKKRAACEWMKFYSK